MKKARLEAVSYYLPVGKLSNEDISNDFPDWSVEKITTKLGISERRIASKDEYASDMAVKAAENLFAQNGIDRSKIDFLLYCTQSPDYFLPTTACILQDQLGLNKTIGALDFNLGCSGFVYGLSLAKGLIIGNMAKNVLLVTSETYSKFLHPRDKSNKTIFGDAAAATLISAEGNGPVIGEFVFGTDGKGAENLIIKNGAVRNRWQKGEDVLNENEEFIRNDDYLYMNGGEIFHFTAGSVPPLIKETLTRNDLTTEDTTLFILHQANKYMLEFIRKKASIPGEKFIYHMESCGNTVSSTIPIALHELAGTRKMINGDSILLAGFGVGYSWAATVLLYE